MNTPTIKRPEQGIALIQTLILVAAVIIIAIIAWLVVKHQSQKPAAATKPTVSSNTTAVKAAAGAPGGTLNIKEFGISVPLAADLKGLTYTADTNPQKTITIVNLKLDAFTALANKCVGQPAGTSQTLASLAKTNGTYDPTQSPRTVNLHQFDGFYVSDLGSSVAQGVVCNDQSVQGQYNDLYGRLTNALNSSFANATRTQ